MGNKKYTKLNLTEIKPNGWLLEHLKAQMSGLTGRLHYDWESVGTYSGWLGGTGDGWERVPYYLDGLLPLSYYLDDKEHMEICMKFINWTLESQDENGNYGPLNTKAEQWSRFCMLKVLIQYYEISKDERVVPFAKNYLKYFAEYTKENGLVTWSKARVPDMMYVAKWLHNETKDDEILPLIEIIDNASYDWSKYYGAFPFPCHVSTYFNWEELINVEHLLRDRMTAFHATHIVNVTMGLKHTAMRYYMTGNEVERKNAKKGMLDIIKYHGVASGCINGDEHLSTNSPTAGSELCSVVEYMFSLQSLIEVFGDAYYADLMEKLAYNALPGTISDDFMSHQYLQQANQVEVSVAKRTWYNNDADAGLFGLEPHFGCCTANMHQGYPRFVDSLWYKEGEDTFLNMVLAPCMLDTTVNGDPLKITVDTNYPFKDTLVYTFDKVPSTSVTIKVKIPS